ncbi:hypothetical protein [Streptomyces sp. 5-10]|uniref:hypothetical protein n=1 Tax=Streptomyces sp. 5-10 TaxID=878925 RepID=UPI00168B3157|nr:hypothetical protein [Streptomyces sp. 5-10]MBD3004573.1 hypothetical protein [Streptomyces sp. 5-10]
MQDILTVRLSDSKRELFVYSGTGELICVKAVRDVGGVTERVGEEVESFIAEEVE